VIGSLGEKFGKRLIDLVRRKKDRRLHGRGPRRRRPWLAGKSLNVSEKGLAIVEQHLTQFGDVPQNTAMIGRLRAALTEGRAISGADASFYMHEVAEATMMGRGMTHGAAHSGALAKYGVSPFSVYHPEAVKEFSSAFNSNWTSFWGL
jgi:hypothetical protein